LRTDVRRVFIVAAPRSGTTILQSYLAAHPRISTFPETSIFVRSYPSSKRWARPFDLAGRLFVTDIKTIARRLNVPVPRRPLTMPGAYRTATRVLDRAAGDVSAWVEKSSRHIQRIDQIERYVPNALFLHVVRDGRDVVASILRVARSHDEWRGSRSIEAAVARWNESAATTMDRNSRASDLVVRYEDLMSDTHTELSRLCDFIEVDFEEVMLERSSGGGIIDAPWKRAVAGPIRFNPGNSFASLPVEDQRRVGELLNRSLMEWFGYDL
jgi:LPS sulfotransferase NodH